MNSYISDYIFYREYDDKNNEEIPYRRCSDERKYDELISNIFSNQYAVYDEEKPSDMPKTKLARWFYNQLYEYPEIRYGGIHGDKVTDIDFINDIILAKGEINRNNLYYITNYKYM